MWQNVFFWQLCWEKKHCSQAWQFITISRESYEPIIGQMNWKTNTVKQRFIWTGVCLKHNLHWVAASSHWFTVFSTPQQGVFIFLPPPGTLLQKMSIQLVMVHFITFFFFFFALIDCCSSQNILTKFKSICSIIFKSKHSLVSANQIFFKMKILKKNLQYKSLATITEPCQLGGANPLSNADKK